MKKLETPLCIIHYSERLEPLAESTVSLLNQKIPEFQSFFAISTNEKIVVNYFDTLEEFREFIYSLRGEKHSLPQYATGTYDNEMVNAYIEPKSQLKRLYTASHELFHIFYMKYILKNDYSKRIVWYDEGMAQFMSGEKDKFTLDTFKDFYLRVKDNTKVIPNLNDLTHGNAFVNEEYNGYDLSYLSIKYLSEQFTKEQFRDFMADFSNIKKIGNDILPKMFLYYDETFEHPIMKK